jgi:hypothetical protein
MPDNKCRWCEANIKPRQTYCCPAHRNRGERLAQTLRENGWALDCSASADSPRLWWRINDARGLPIVRGWHRSIGEAIEITQAGLLEATDGA